jgi:CheY-like chemotaxis protein
MSEAPSILLAEDDETDVLLLRRAFKEADLQNPVHVARDGQEVMDFLSPERRAPADRLPALVILDLKMPRRNGMDVLKWMRDQKALSCIPVIVFSSSAHRADIERAYAAGANAVIVKPPSTTDRAEIARFIRQWIKFNQLPLACTEGSSAAVAAHAMRNLQRRANQ